MNLLKNMISTNYSYRSKDVEIDTIVLHATGPGSVQAIINTFENPEEKKSAHYLVGKNGGVVQFVDEKNKAWHCGESSWNGKEHVNDFSIGIEILNNGEEYPPIQINAVADLVADIMKRYRSMGMADIVGHCDVAVPPGRKVDPGKHFPWSDFRAKVRAKI